MRLSEKKRNVILSYFHIEPYILYEDPYILVCHKPPGIAVQSARLGSPDMECAIKNYYAEKEPGKLPYVGIVHRLDQPVEGVLVFARTPQAAGELSRQMAGGEFGKKYLAVTLSKPEMPRGVLEDYLKKDGRDNYSRVVPAGTPGAKKARLSYEVLGELSGPVRYLLAVQLETGRHHQIRVQLSHAGMPLAGDKKYHPGDPGILPLGLCSVELRFVHPATKKKMNFQVEPTGEAFTRK